jgi:hypothetical protein
VRSAPSGRPSCRSQLQSEKSNSSTSLGGRCVLGSPDEKRQLPHRFAAPLIRFVLAQFRAGLLSARATARKLHLSRSRFHELKADYLRACAHHQQEHWSPGVSGGDHSPDWPAAVLVLLRKRLSSVPPSNYSFLASEVLRLCGFKLDRAQVRRWAIENQLAHPKPNPQPRAPVRRWQRSQIGELWQFDVSPHRWFPGVKQLFPMFNLLDDCSRLFVASQLYERETLLAYYDFLPAAFLEYGLPLELYVDFHSFFFTHVPDALTQLGAALHFYGVSFRYAPTPQAKGKIEREHQFWQNRLPAYFASEAITDLHQANPHIRDLRRHRNQQETHRELQMKPQAAWDIAQKEKRSALRPVPGCPWWPFVWSLRTEIKVGDDGRVPIGAQRLRLEVPPRTKVVLCQHPSGHYSVLATHPSHTTKPQILFSNLPKSNPAP